MAHKLKRAILCVTLLFTACSACRFQSQSSSANPAQDFAGEPEKYSATVVRLIESDAGREETISRIVVSPDGRREEWTDASGKRALIFRPDLQKSFLLDLDNNLYVENDFTQTGATGEINKPSQPNSNRQTENAENPSAQQTTSQSIEPDFLTDEFQEEPVNIDSMSLPDETIRGFVCHVSEQNRTFADGRAERQKAFRARSLNNLLIKSESETISPNRRIKITLERRDIKFDVSANEFTVPTGFKKVERLSLP
ncbi:MAG: hypothetical protein AB1757_08165 [Acidobacteriota bacterium]